MANATSAIRFIARLHRPGGKDKGADWIFLRLPDEASHQLPSRSKVSVEGTLNGQAFQATLDPDGKGGHWLKVTSAGCKTFNVKAGDEVALQLGPAVEEPEPEVPDDFRQALETAPEKALETWGSITRIARRDYIHWMTSGKKAETRVKRIEVAISKLSVGNRRPCCFDRSGMYDKSLSCPIEDE